MPEDKKLFHSVCCQTTFSYTDGHIVVSYKKEPLMRFKKETRLEGFAFVKEKRTEIIGLVISKLRRSGLL